MLMNFIFEWKVAYQPGTLEAIARDESGKEIARDKITTAGKPAGCSSYQRRTMQSQQMEKT